MTETGPGMPPRASGATFGRARDMRLQEATFDEIPAEPGISKGSIPLSARDPSKRVPSGAAPERPKVAARKRWDQDLALHDVDRRRSRGAGHGRN
jgi:hypothetical protein